VLYRLPSLLPPALKHGSCDTLNQHTQPQDPHVSDEPVPSKKHGVSMKKLQHWTAKAKHAVANSIKDPSDRTAFKPKEPKEQRDPSAHDSHESSRGEPSQQQTSKGQHPHHTPLQQQIQQLLKGQKGKRHGSPQSAPGSAEREGQDMQPLWSREVGAAAPAEAHQQRQPSTASSGGLTTAYLEPSFEGVVAAVATAATATAAATAAAAQPSSSSSAAAAAQPSSTADESAPAAPAAPAGDDQVNTALASCSLDDEGAAGSGKYQHKPHAPFKGFTKHAAQQAAVQAASKIRGAAAATAAAMAAAGNVAKGHTLVAAAAAAAAVAQAGLTTRDAQGNPLLGAPSAERLSTTAAATILTGGKEGRDAAPRDPQAAIRVTSHKRAGRSGGVSEVALAQSVAAHSGVIWCAGLSRDRRFLATAGQDCVLRIWQLTGSRHDEEARAGWAYDEQDRIHQRQRQRQEHVAASESCASDAGGTPTAAAAAAAALDSAAASSGGEEDRQQRERAGGDDKQQQPAGAGDGGPIEWGPYLSAAPVREYHGHTEDILDLSWSASGFLLTASMDQSVRLWHLSQPDCLKVFRHSDFVTCCQFHPTDAHRFVSGASLGLCVYMLWVLLGAVQ